jgi:alkylation response protein AidB-like acyl-CoA dehydrogenase
MLTEPVTDEDTLEIRAVVRRFLTERLPSDRLRRLAATDTGYDGADWTAMAEMGWPALGLPEELGGAGYGPPQFAVLCEELGRSLAGGPLLASAGFALPVLAACTDAVSGELVGALAAGERIAALVDDPAGALAVGDEGTLDGTVPRVLDAAAADVLVIASGGAVLLVDSNARGVRITARPTADPSRRVAQVSFTGAGATRLALGSPERLSRARAAADVYLAAAQVGGAARSLELTLEYMRTRQQFGRPIGSFQALKHRAADAAVAVSLARELVHDAAAILETGTAADVTLAARAALVQAATTFQRVSGEAIQLHGGIGFTEEHDIGLYYRRALADRDLRGAVVDHRAALVEALGWR